MIKIKDHIVLIIADLAAFLACIYVYIEYINITKNVYERVDNITLQSNYGFFFISIIIPIIHGVSCIKKNNLNTRYVNYAFIFIFLCLLVTNFWFDFWLESKVVDAGYTYCEAMSKSMRMIDFNVYLKAGVECLK